MSGSEVRTACLLVPLFALAARLRFTQIGAPAADRPDPLIGFAPILQRLVAPSLIVLERDRISRFRNRCLGGLRLRCPDEAKTAIVDRIREHYKGKHHVDELDGARIHFPSGWALVRQSNTQPVISMRFEAHSGAQLGAIQDEVQSLVESAIAEISDS